jgi:hypothetical protein
LTFSLSKILDDSTIYVAVIVPLIFKLPTTPPAPIIIEVAVIVLPTFKLPPTPAPPTTIKAPDVVETEDTFEIKLRLLAAKSALVVAVLLQAVLVPM